MTTKTFFIVISCLVILFPCPVLAKDILKTFIPDSPTDPRSNYDIELYKEVMKASQSEFGPYEIRHTPRNASQDRDLAEVISGELVNVDIVAARPLWECQTIPIRIPLLKDMLGIRLFLVRKDTVDAFSKIKNLAELKRLSAGLGRTWTITRALERQGFHIVKGSAYDGLFGMLSNGRFDYFPRGLNEIYLEYDQRRAQYPNLAIEPALALYVPLPTFFFVSPNAPRLAQRLEWGLKQMQSDGSFDRLFNKHFGQFYKKARISKRKFFKVGNPLLTEETLKAIQ